jgi:hypothetical protein
VPSCNGTGCVYTCVADFAACDGDMGNANGCEVDLRSDKNHCNGCNMACPTGGPGGSVPGKCVARACRLDCPANTGDCDGNRANGCEIDLLVSGLNCGRCNPNQAAVLNDPLNPPQAPGCQAWNQMCCAGTCLETSVCQ